jgi:hypothetical protein
MSPLGPAFLLARSPKKYLFPLVIGLFVGSLLQPILPSLTQAIVDYGTVARFYYYKSKDLHNTDV